MLKKLYFEYVGNIEKFVEFTLKIYTSIFFGRTKRSKNTEPSEMLKLDTVLSKLSMCFPLCTDPTSFLMQHFTSLAPGDIQICDTYIKLTEEAKYINLPPFLDSIGSYQLIVRLHFWHLSFTFSSPWSCQFLYRSHLLVSIKSNFIYTYTHITFSIPSSL